MRVLMSLRASFLCSLGLVASIPLRPKHHALLEGAEVTAGAGVSVEADQPRGILWAENTTEFMVGVVLLILGLTACWFFERQLARLECLLAVGQNTCVKVQGTEALAENHGQLVHVTGSLRATALQDPRFVCEKLAGNCTRLRTHVQVFQSCDGVSRWSEESRKGCSMAVGTTTSNAREVRLGENFCVPDGLLDQCRDFCPAAKLLGPEVVSRDGLRFQQHKDGFFYWRPGSGWSAQQVAQEPREKDLRARFEVTLCANATALALQVPADLDATLLPFRLVSPFGDEKQLRVQAAKKSRINLALEEQIWPQSRLCCSCNFVAGCCAGVATPEIFRLYQGHKTPDACFAELRKGAQLDVGLGVWTFRLLVLALIVAGVFMSFSEAVLHVYPVVTTRITLARTIASASISLALMSSIKGAVFFPFKIGKAFIHVTLAGFFMLFPLIILC